MNVEDYIEKLRPIVTEMFGNEKSGHDISHLERTKNNALYICRKENGDEVVVGIAAFLHDVHRLMQGNSDKFVQPKDSIETIKRILKQVDLTQEQVDEICFCIEHHEEYNWNGNNVTNKNALILQDADNLDAIGAIGIGRSFSYGAVHNIPMYTGNEKLADKYVENRHSDSTIGHFHEKLLKLGENMNTKTGKELANDRINFMNDFVKRFENEWNGKYDN